MKSVIAQRCSGVRASSERRHRRAVEPRAHRPEDVLAGRPSAEGPGLREVCRAYRMLPVVHQGWSRRSVAATEVAVALYAAGVHVELLPELDRLFRGFRRARQLHGLGHLLLVREVGGERRNEVGEIRHFLVGEGWPGGHRRVRHAAPDDVDEVLMGRERSVGRRPNLELARREVPGPREQVRSGVAFAVTLLAVALRTVFEIELLARLPLRLGSDVLSRRARRSHRRRTTRRSGARDTRSISHRGPREKRERTDQARSHYFAASSLARGLSR